MTEMQIHPKSRLRIMNHLSLELTQATYASHIQAPKLVECLIDSIVSPKVRPKLFCNLERNAIFIKSDKTASREHVRLGARRACEAVLRGAEVCT